jgi:hypothetical protein
MARSWTFGDPDKPSGTLRRLDVALPATGSSGVRIYVLDGAVETPPNAVHAWDFLTGIDGADPDAPEGLPELPALSARDLPLELVPDLPMLIVPDGQSVLSEDAEGMGYPEVVLDGDTVTAPRQPARRQP